MLQIGHFNSLVGDVITSDLDKKLKKAKTSLCTELGHSTFDHREEVLTARLCVLQ